MAGEYHDLKKLHYLNLIRECAVNSMIPVQY